MYVVYIWYTLYTVTTLYCIAACPTLVCASHPVQVNINSCLVEAGVAQWTREEGTGGQGGGGAAVLEVGRVTGGGVSEQQTMLDDSRVRGKVTWLLGRKVLGACC